LIHSNVSKIIAHQELLYNELQKQGEIQNVKYQNIIYFMNNLGKTVDSKSNTSIDFLMAMSEMESLDYKSDNSFIGFVNKKTNECLQFARRTQDDWYAEVVINHGNGWDGYCWCADSKIDIISNMLRLFFEEVPWFEMLTWKMRRFKH
jgi:hypothetical protein